MYKKFVALLPEWTKMSWWLGTALVVAIALVAVYLADLGWIKQLGLGSMALAILLGIVLGNTLFPFIAQKSASGVDYAKNTLLRLGIILYGFNISFQQTMAVAGKQF